MHCPNCKTKLIYESQVTAPGYGQNWTCPNCNSNFHKVGEDLTNWKDVDPQIFNTGEF